MLGGGSDGTHDAPDSGEKQAIFMQFAGKERTSRWPLVYRAAVVTRRAVLQEVRRGRRRRRSSGGAGIPAEPAARSSTARPPRTSSGTGTEDGPEVSVAGTTVAVVSVVVGVEVVFVVVVSVVLVVGSVLVVSVSPSSRATGRCRPGRACPASQRRAHDRSLPWRSSSRGRRAEASRSPPCSNGGDRSCRPGRRRTSRRSPGRRSFSLSPGPACCQPTSRPSRVR